MDQQTVTLIAAVVAVIVAVFNLLLNSRFTLDRERRLVIWRKEVDRLFELEELAGRLVEDIGSYKALETVCARVDVPLEQLEAMGGRLARYPKVRQSARELVMTLKTLLYERRKHMDDREERTNLEPAYRALLEACDEVLGKRSV